MVRVKAVMQKAGSGRGAVAGVQDEAMVNRRVRVSIEERAVLVTASSPVTIEALTRFKQRRLRNQNSASEVSEGKLTANVAA